MSSERGKKQKFTPNHNGSTNNIKPYDAGDVEPEVDPPPPPPVSLSNGLPEVLTDNALCNGTLDESAYTENPVLPDVIPSFQSQRREVLRLTCDDGDQRCDYRSGNPDLLWTGDFILLNKIKGY